MASTQRYVLWSTYANGGPMAIPTLASVDSHVILIILYYTLGDTGAWCVCASSCQSKYGRGGVQVVPIQYRNTGGKQKNAMTAI
jgi:hypothetical protein